VTGLVVLLVVVVVATAAGLLWRRRDGRVRPTGVDRGAVLAGLGVQPDRAQVTFVQFSSAFCAPCRATRQILARVADTTPGVVHVEVDAESHLAQVRELGILRTPTTLVIDDTGREVSRIGGQPTLATVRSFVGQRLAS